MTYRVVISNNAERQLQRIQQPTLRRLKAAILALADEPRPNGTKALQGEDAYRVRVGDYRIVYVIEDTVLTVTVVRVAHRREVYRR